MKERTKRTRKKSKQLENREVSFYINHPEEILGGSLIWCHATEPCFNSLSFLG